VEDFDGFDVLDEMARDGNPNFRMFDAGTNLIDIKENGGLREGWGEITLAIDSKTAKELLDASVGLTRGEYFCGLFVYPMNDYYDALAKLKEGQ